MQTPKANLFSFTTAFFGFILGIVIHTVWNIFAVGIFVLVLFLVFISWGLFFRKVSFLFVAFVLFFICLGFFRSDIERYRYPDTLSQFENKSIVARGIVVKPRDTRDTNARVTILLKEIDVGGEKYRRNQKVILTTGLYPEFSYGDEIVFRGKLEKVKDFSLENVGHFNYPAYLRKDGIYQTSFYPAAEIVAENQGNFFKRKLYGGVKVFSESLERHIHFPESALALGMLVGEKHAFPKELETKITKAGLSHIVVLSGYNIALVVLFLSYFTSFFSRRVHFILIVVAISLFVLATGAEAASVRAALMASILLLGKTIGRTYDQARALGVAILLMLFENPNILLYDPSFQLSVLAMCGMIFILEPLKQKLFFITDRFNLRELVSATLSAQIAVFPFLAYLIGTVSLVSLPANILALPLVPGAMLLSFVTSLLGLVSSVLAFPFAILSFIFLYPILFVAEFFGSLPLASVTTPLPLWGMLLCYAIGGVVYKLLYPRRIIR